MSPALTRALVAAGLLASSPLSALPAQPGHTVSAITVSGNGSETFVLLSGLVGGVAGFRRLEAHFPHEEAPAELARWLIVPRSQIVAQNSAGVR